MVQSLHRADGEPVAAGDLVISLSDPALEARMARQQAQLSALQSQWHAALPDDPARSAELQARLKAAAAELARLAERAQGLQVRAAVSGTLVLPQAADLLGRHAAQGRLLGQVITAAPPTVRVALPEDRAGSLDETAATVQVWRVDMPAAVHSARLQHDSRAAVLQLPSAALSRRHGGSIDTDPQDPEALRSRQPVLLLDVQLEQATAAHSLRLGSRAWVKFDHGHAPLAWQWWQAWQRHWRAAANPQA
jgi:putative peptide zinc metalloprotease protein